MYLKSRYFIYSFLIQISIFSITITQIGCNAIELQYFKLFGGKNRFCMVLYRLQNNLEAKTRGDSTGILSTRVSVSLNMKSDCNFYNLHTIHSFFRYIHIWIYVYIYRE
jgi:hypothetical protein